MELTGECHSYWHEVADQDSQYNLRDNAEKVVRNLFTLITGEAVWHTL